MLTGLPGLRLAYHAKDIPAYVTLIYLFIILEHVL